MSAARYAVEAQEGLQDAARTWGDREDLMRQNVAQVEAYLGRQEGDAESLALALVNLRQVVAVLDLVRAAQEVAR